LTDGLEGREFTWHCFGRDKPVKLTPLLRIFRR
jgi:hypothetical protein